MKWFSVLEERLDGLLMERLENPEEYLMDSIQLARIQSLQCLK